MGTMKAAVCTARETIIIEQVPKPVPREGEVLVKGGAVAGETARAVAAGPGGSAAGVVVAVTGAADEGGGTACGGATGGALWPTRQMIKPATSARASDNSSRSFMP